MDNYVKGVKVIEIYDAANKEVLVKYDDKHNIDKVISALNIKSWKETEKSIVIMVASRAYVWINIFFTITNICWM